MSGTARILDRLQRGPATAAELYGLHCIVHSRIAELRKQGHVIVCERTPGEGGAAAYVYRIVDGPLTERVGAGIGRDSGGSYAAGTKPKTTETQARLARRSGSGLPGSSARPAPNNSPSRWPREHRQLRLPPGARHVRCATDARELPPLRLDVRRDGRCGT